MYIFKVQKRKHDLFLKVKCVIMAPTVSKKCVRKQWKHKETAVANNRSLCL